MVNRHNLIMLACVAAPVALVVIMYGFGIKSNAIYWIALLLCPLIHFVMMQSHKDGEKKCH